MLNRPEVVLQKSTSVQFCCIKTKQAGEWINCSPACKYKIVSRIPAPVARKRTTRALPRLCSAPDCFRTRERTTSNIPICKGRAKRLDKSSALIFRQKAAGFLIKTLHIRQKQPKWRILPIVRSNSSGSS